MGRGTSKASAGGGNTTPTAAVEPKKPTGDEFVQKYGRWEDKSQLIKDFGLEDASRAQISSLQEVIRGITKYDQDLHSVEVDGVDISMMGKKKTAEDKERERWLYGKVQKDNRPIQVAITTRPISDSAYIRIADAKTRSFLIGRNGGFYDYKNGKRRSVDKFKAVYGERWGWGV